ncbi:MAG: DUF5908 family protein [Cyanobacteria bacterium P01_B01_bin.77]
MPLEIRELVIKTTISDGESAQGASSGNADQAALIAECVEQVLAILREKSER